MIKRIAATFTVLLAAVGAMAVSYEAGSSSADGSTISPTKATLTRTNAFVPTVDYVMRSSWTAAPTGTGLLVGNYSFITSTSTGGGTGHTISTFGDAYSVGTNDIQMLIGVEGKATVKGSAQADSRSYGLVGRGIYDKSGSLSSVAAGVYASGEMYTGDGTTPNDTGTAIGVYIPATVGGASGTKYGVLQSGDSDLNDFAGIMNFRSFIILAPRSGGVACGAGLAGWVYTDSTATPDELCFCDGANWQGISSGTDANCS